MSDSDKPNTRLFDLDLLRAIVTAAGGELPQSDTGTKAGGRRRS